jgi:hypothetical protein
VSAIRRPKNPYLRLSQRLGKTVKSSDKPVLLRAALGNIALFSGEALVTGLRENCKNPVGGSRPYVLAFSRGKQVRNISRILPSKPVWSTDADHGCHSALARAGGFTFRVSNVGQLFPNVELLQKSMQNTCGEVGTVDAFYSTPRSASAIPSHRDPAIQAVFQVEGAKNWFFGNSGCRMAMKPGDVLVIPFSHLHRAECISTYSIHLTLGINPDPFARLVEIMIDAFRSHDAS